MKMYGSHEPLSLFDVEALLYVQEAQYDKFTKKFVVSNISANLAHANSKTGGVHETLTSNHG